MTTGEMAKGEMISDNFNEDLEMTCVSVKSIHDC